MSAPAFLNKPKHKDNVIATPKGWVVEKTGELLVSVKNLDQRIAEHLGLPTFQFESARTTEVTELPEGTALSLEAPVTADTSIDDLLDTLDTAKPDVVVEDIVEDVVKESAEPVVAEKKKRGGYRPRKPKVDA
jgi:hypothetical protein